MFHIKARTLCAVTLCLTWGSAAWAQTGVSDDRVSLPEGAGSLEGFGENVGVSPNMGAASQAFDIPVPGGFNSVTPSLGLSYSSGGGSSVVGMGWSMGLPSIERMTSRGLPEYNSDDLFAADGSAQLVQVSDGEPAVYRARFEGGFVRYKWFERGAGDGGYWVAEYPDGTRGFFGADSAGQSVDAAREEGAEGTFAYHMVEKVDAYGHRMRIDHRLSAQMALPVRIGWVFDDNDRPRYEVRFVYEDRPDVVSDGKAGFEMRLEERLARVEVLAQGSVIQSYHFTYEDGPEAGGFSRLVRAERQDAGGEVFPIVQRYGYSRAVGGVCGDNEPGCVSPFVVSMGNLGINFQSRSATLIDINNDALPDVIDTTPEGAHRFFINRFDGRDAHRFEAAGESVIGTRSNHNLQAGNVQVIDVDGDGLADMLNTRTGNVLLNGGDGDWSQALALFNGNGGLPDLGTDLDVEDGALTSIRFLDYNGDKRIDVIKSQGSGAQNVTQIFRNLSEGGFQSDPNVQQLAVGFENDRLQMADINGDGLLDPVQLLNTSLSYQLNLGRGRWGQQVVVGDVPFDLNNTAVELVEIEDLNNDGVADIVIVEGGTVTYALGRNGGQFAPPVTLDSAALGQEIPTRFETTTVLFADMNANGSTDIVWIDLNGEVTYLDAFPVQPHLLSQITNGLGRTTRVSYSTAVELAAQARAEGTPWASLPPFPMLAVTQTEIFDSLNDQTEVTRYTYRDSFYDGVEKQARGFERVEVRVLGDEHAEDSVTALTFDLGRDDPYRAGLLLEEVMFSDQRPLRTVRNTYEDCPVAEIPEGLDFDVRFVCRTLDTTIIQEGAPEDEWATIEIASTYDGYGSVVREESRGVTAIGGGACEPCQRDEAIFGTPCGATCRGDEVITVTEPITPEANNDVWILGRPVRELAFGREGGQVTEKLYFYDGEPFVGLPEGGLTQGNVTRIMLKTDEGQYVAQARIRYDSHGNAVESIRATGSVDVADDHRSRQEFDAQGLNLVAQERLLNTPEGEPYRLRQEVRYDPTWNRIAETTDWMIVQDGQVVSPRHAQGVVYDSFGRLSERFATGGGASFQTRIRRELQEPVSRVILERRGLRGEDPDLVTVRCFDGFGRLFQTRTRVAQGRWAVNGFVVRNSRGLTLRTYSEYNSDSELCDVAPPEGVAYMQYRLDAAGRTVRRTWTSAEGELTRVTQYGPLFSAEHDEHDLDEAHPHFETPVIKAIDGLGRQTSLSRVKAGGDVVTHRFEYDETGGFHRIIDPEGNVKTQSFDLAGRLVQIDDPDRGTITYQRDASGSVTRLEDGQGRVTVAEFDGLGRQVTSYNEANPENTTITYRYDIPSECPGEVCTNAAHRLVERDWPEASGRGSDWLGYGARGELLRTTRVIEGRRFDFEMTYDLGLRPVSRRYPDGQVVEYQWDSSYMTAIPGVVDEVVTGDSGLVTEVTLANGVRTAWDYDAARRLIGLAVTGAGDETLLDRRFSYNGLDQIVEVRDEAPQAGGPTANARFEYDALGRLTQALLDEGNAAHEELMRYGYDDIDNLISKTSSLEALSPAHVGAMAYGQGGVGPHAVTEAGGMTMEYDASGAMVRRGDMTLDWDHDGRLVRVTNDAGEVLSESVYGATEDKLIERSTEGTLWQIAEDFEIRDGVSVVHVNVGNVPVARLESLALAAQVLSDVAPVESPDGAINAGDAWVAVAAQEGVLELAEQQVDRVGDLLQGAVAALLAADAPQTFVHTDHRGTTLATTSGAGELQELHYWYPFGMARGDSVDDAGEPGFNGQRYAAGTGLVYFGARHLDPWLGRWLSPDPLFTMTPSTVLGDVGQALGSYTFVGNNPVSYHDHDGNIIGVIIGVSVAVAVVALAAMAYGFWRKTRQFEAGLNNNQNNADLNYAQQADLAARVTPGAGPGPGAVVAPGGAAVADSQALADADAARPQRESVVAPGSDGVADLGPGRSESSSLVRRSSRSESAVSAVYDAEAGGAAEGFADTGNIVTIEEGEAGNVQPDPAEAEGVRQRQLPPDALGNVPYMELLQLQNEGLKRMLNPNAEGVPDAAAAEVGGRRNNRVVINRRSNRVKITRYKANGANVSRVRVRRGGNR